MVACCYNPWLGRPIRTRESKVLGDSRIRVLLRCCMRRIQTPTNVRGAAFRGLACIRSSFSPVRLQRLIFGVDQGLSESDLPDDQMWKNYTVLKFQISWPKLYENIWYLSQKNRCARHVVKVPSPGLGWHERALRCPLFYFAKMRHIIPPGYVGAARIVDRWSEGLRLVVVNVSCKRRSPAHAMLVCSSERDERSRTPQSQMVVSHHSFNSKWR